jgi:hypothetical protein
VALLAPFDRPLALQLLGAATRANGASPHLPPIGRAIECAGERPTARRTPLEIAHFLAHVLLSDVTVVRGLLPELEASVDEEVLVWSPCVCTRSRTALVTALLDGDDAITEVQVSIIGASATESTVHLEWHFEGRFNNCGFLNDDVLIEPSGATVAASGVLVVELRQSRATHIRCYYDGLGLLEQVVRPPTT